MGNPEDVMSPNDPSLDPMIKVFIAVLIIAVLFEATILGIAYFNADEVNCNFLWCSFKTVRGNSVINEDIRMVLGLIVLRCTI